METVIEHEIELEVAGAPPRAVRLPWRTQSLLALAGALALLLFLAGARALLEAVKLGWVAVAGRTVTARVTEIQADPAEAPGQPARQTGRRYEYTDPFDLSAPRQSRFVRVGADPHDSAGPMMGGGGTPQAKPPAPPVIHVGDGLPLRVARWGGRSVAYFWSPAPWGKGLFLALCGLVVMVVSLGLVRALARWRRLRARLLSQGQAVIATIIHKRADVGDTPRYYLHYGYATAPAGEKLEHEEQVSMDQWKRFEIGQPVTALYDPAMPALVGLYALMKS